MRTPSSLIVSNHAEGSQAGDSANTRPRLETDRLILRMPALDDLDRWAEMMADENAARFIGGVAPKTIVWRMIMQMVGAWELTDRKSVV